MRTNLCTPLRPLLNYFRLYCSLVCLPPALEFLSIVTANPTRLFLLTSFHIMVVQKLFDQLPTIFSIPCRFLSVVFSTRIKPLNQEISHPIVSPSVPLALKNLFHYILLMIINQNGLCWLISSGFKLLGCMEPS